MSAASPKRRRSLRGEGLQRGTRFSTELETNRKGTSMSRNVTALGLGMLFTALAMTGCNSGGGGGGGGTAPLNNCSDAAGDWMIDEMSFSACGDENATYSIQVAQTDCSLVVSTPSGVFTGSVAGDSVTWAGSYPEDGGTTTISNLSVTIAADGMSLTGSSNWTWTDGTTTCTGTTQIQGDRL